MHSRRVIGAELRRRIQSEGCDGDFDVVCLSTDSDPSEWCLACLASLMLASKPTLTLMEQEAVDTAISELRWWHDQPGEPSDEDVDRHARLGLVIADKLTQLRNNVQAEEGVQTRWKRRLEERRVLAAADASALVKSGG